MRCARGLLLAGLLAVSAHAQSTVPATDRIAIRAVIAAQIDAFRRNDAAAAFALAAPGIKARFGDREHFMAMVRTAYPAVFRPRSVSFGAIAGDRASLKQKVTLTGPDGRMAVALYSMEHEADGAWRIASCALTTGTDQEI